MTIHPPSGVGAQEFKISIPDPPNAFCQDMLNWGVVVDGSVGPEFELELSVDFLHAVKIRMQTKKHINRIINFVFRNSNINFLFKRT